MVRRPAVALACVLAMQAPDAFAQDEASRARTAYARAVELESKGNNTAALALLGEAAGLAPRDPEIQNRFGEALDRIGALDAAIDAYKRAVTERPSFKKAVNNLILGLVKTGRGEQAVARARAIVAAASSDPDSYFTLGLAQSEQDVTASLASFRRAIEIEPRHTLARYNLALVLKRIDRLPEAAEELARAIAIEPRPEAQYTLAVICWYQGDLDRAASLLRAAVDSQPGYADAYVTLGAVLKTKRAWTEAVDALRRAIAIRPDLAAPRYTLSQVLELSGDPAAARAERAEADRVRRHAELTQEAGVWTAVGIQKLEGRDLFGALDCLRRATAVFDGYAPAHYQMGRVLEQLGEPEAARAAFARAHQLNPSLLPPKH